MSTDRPGHADVLSEGGASRLPIGCGTSIPVTPGDRARPGFLRRGCQRPGSIARATHFERAGSCDGSSQRSRGTIGRRPRARPLPARARRRGPQPGTALGGRRTPGRSSSWATHRASGERALPLDARGPHSVTARSGRHTDLHRSRGSSKPRRACRARWSRTFTAASVIPSMIAASAVSTSSMSRMRRTIR